MAIPTSTVTASTNYIVNTVDASLSAATIAAGTASATTNSTSAYSYAGAKKTEIEIIAGTTSTTVGTLTVNWNVYEPTSGSVITTYSSSAINTATITVIAVNGATQNIGAYGYLSWTTAATAVATFSPVTVRVLQIP